MLCYWPEVKHLYTLDAGLFLAMYSTHAFVLAIWAPVRTKVHMTVEATTGCHCCNSIAAVVVPFAGASCELVPCQRLDEILWEKAAVNCFINPLTALLNCLNGQLADPHMELARCA